MTSSILKLSYLNEKVKKKIFFAFYKVEFYLNLSILGTPNFGTN